MHFPILRYRDFGRLSSIFKKCIPIIYKPKDLFVPKGFSNIFLSKLK